MATIGLKINQPDSGYGNAGTGIADIFSKALFADPEREAKIRLMKERELSQRAYQDKLKADTGMVNQKATTEGFERDTRRNAIPAFQNYYEGLATPPVPVEPPRTADVPVGPMQPVITPQAQQQYMAERAWRRQQAAAILAGGGNAEQIARGTTYGPAAAALQSTTSPDMARRLATIVTGTFPNVNSVAVAGDTAGVNAAADAEARKPQVIEGPDKGKYIYTPGGVASPIPGLPRPNPLGSTENAFTLKFMSEYEAKKQAGAPTTPDEDTMYLNAKRLMQSTMDPLQTFKPGDFVGRRNDAGDLVPTTAQPPGADKFGDTKAIIEGVSNKHASPDAVITPEEARKYAIAHNNEYGVRLVKRTYQLPGGGTEDRIEPEQNQPPLGIPTPDEVYTRAGVPPGARPPITTTGAVPGGPAGSPVTTAAPAGAAPAQAVGPGGVSLGVKPAVSTEHAEKNARFIREMTAGESYMQHVVPSDVPNLLQTWLTLSHGDLTQDIFLNSFADTDARAFAAKALNIISGVMRLETGAAIKNEEFGMFYKRFIPLPTDDQRVINIKRQARSAVLAGMNDGTLPTGTRRDVDAYLKEKNINLGYDAEELPPSARQPKAAPTTGPAPVSVPTTGTWSVGKDGRPVQAPSGGR